jgi:hypothetical protein
MPGRFISKEALHDALEVLRGDQPKPPWTRTDREGSFDLPPPDDVDVLLLATHPDHMDACKRFRWEPGKAPGAFRIVLHRAMNLRGRVVDGDTGAGVPGIPVEADQFQDDWCRLSRSVSGADGAFVLEGLRSWGAFLRTLIGPDHELYGALEGKPARARGGDTDALVKVFKKGFVRFRAVEAGTGRPLSAELRARPMDHEAPPRWGAVSMEAQGRYVFGTLRGAWNFELSARGYHPVSVKFDVVPWERTELGRVLRFRRGVRIEGSVTLDRRNAPHPIKGVQVLYEALDGRDGTIRFVVPTEKEPTVGEYRTPALDPGLYRIVAIASGFLSEAFEIQVGAEGAEHDFHLTTRTPGGPRLRPRFRFEQRKDVKICLDFMDVPLEEVVAWFVAATGADIRIREGTALEKDESMVQLRVDGLPLEDVIQLIVRFQGLEFDEERGEIYRKE